MACCTGSGTGPTCVPGQCAQFIGNIPISLNPLTTGTSSLSNLDSSLCTAVDTPYACCTGAGTGNCTGVFCPLQDVNQKGAFLSSICFGGANDGKPCTVPANCPSPGTCRSGLLSNYCVGGDEDGLGCNTALVGQPCGTGGTCQRAGTQAQLIREVGNPAGALAIGVPKAIRLASAFCVQATTNTTVNANANLPAAGATSVVGTVTLVP